MKFATVFPVTAVYLAVTVLVGIQDMIEVPAGQVADACKVIVYKKRQGQSGPSAVKRYFSIEGGRNLIIGSKGKSVYIQLNLECHPSVLIELLRGWTCALMGIRWNEQLTKNQVKERVLEIHNMKDLIPEQITPPAQANGKMA